MKDSQARANVKRIDQDIEAMDARVDRLEHERMKFTRLTLLQQDEIDELEKRLNLHREQILVLTRHQGLPFPVESKETELC